MPCGKHYIHATNTQVKNMAGSISMEAFLWHPFSVTVKEGGTHFAFNDVMQRTVAASAAPPPRLLLPPRLQIKANRPHEDRSLLVGHLLVDCFVAFEDFAQMTCLTHIFFIFFHAEDSETVGKKAWLHHCSQRTRSVLSCNTMPAFCGSCS
jgi:hypothetical protein